MGLAVDLQEKVQDGDADRHAGRFAVVFDFEDVAAGGGDCAGDERQFARRVAHFNAQVLVAASIGEAAADDRSEQVDIDIPA